MKNRGGFVLGGFLFCALLFSGCLGADQSRPLAVPASPQTDQTQAEMNIQAERVQLRVHPVSRKAAAAFPVIPDDTVLGEQEALPGKPQDKPTAEPSPTPILPTPTSLPELANSLSPEQWKEWPVLPSVSAEMRAVYQRGLQQGSNPNAFSVLGDCQSQPEVFMGVYDSDPAIQSALIEPLRETVAQFSGSFDRYSPTVKDGTTEGALLWYEWNDNKEKKCMHGETPLDCELRVHEPSIVFIHVGTHWESRNLRYLKVIIERILEHGAVPVLVTKADNRELDERVNQNMAFLAAEYNLPMWNFWASVQHLPDNGMMRNSDMYLSDEGVEVHRVGALEALDQVWRAVR